MSWPSKPVKHHKHQWPLHHSTKPTTKPTKPPTWLLIDINILINRLVLYGLILVPISRVGVGVILSRAIVIS